MKMKTKIGLLSVLFFGLTFTACESYPDYDDYIEEQLVSMSTYSNSADFSQYSTYSISDTVAIVNNGEVSKVLITDPKYPYLQKYVNLVKTNMDAVGYTFTASKNPDLGIMLSLVKSTNVYVSYPWWWWEYCYWYYWDCGYTPYYPYPYPVVVGGYSVGVLSMDMFDVKHKTGSKVSAVWTGVVRGLYTGGHSDAEIATAIDKCFDQTTPFQK